MTYKEFERRYMRSSEYEGQCPNYLMGVGVRQEVDALTV